jgi:ABC-type Zn uptake system ZnuABC Zn-binding protein ZnuA
LKSFDPHFFRMTHAGQGWVDTAFLLLVTLNTVCAFQALGSLLALGLLLIPAITARLWTRHIWTMCLASTGLALLSSIAGILISYYGGYPTGPLIILVATTFYGIACLSQWKTTRYKSLRRLLMWVPFLLLPVYLYQKTPALIRPQVVVSFTVLEDFVNILTEGKVRTYTLVGPDQDPHQFEPTPDDMTMLASADLVILNGLHLENHWLPKFMEMQPQVPVVEAAANVNKRFFTIGNQAVPDPHAWHDVQQAKIYVQTIAQALVQIWPDLSTTINSNASRYLTELDELEKWIRRRLERLVHSRRHVITTHDGFGYFERAYGIHFLTPLGPSTTADPSPTDIKKVLISARQHDVRGIFFENMVPRQHITMLAETARLTVGGILYSDALSSASHAKTYLGMMRHNVRTLLAHM